MAGDACGVAGRFHERVLDVSMEALSRPSCPYPVHNPGVDRNCFASVLCLQESPPHMNEEPHVPFVQQYHVDLDHG
ncbi:hypothetical protein M513_10823 [Trichuris suis]|uniref:Uncharacterized protein n=1 Tax=Trichuris suis TaxID=68888 RepID=A0A085LTN5_9BILA|nr:hypothetical protein M513_10823 [Trichuris suis]